MQYQNTFNSPEFKVYQTAMFIDMVNSTRMKEQMPEHGWQYELGWLFDLVIRKIREVGGARIVKSTGDGAFIVFEDTHVTESINSAIQMQEAISDERGKNQLHLECSIGIATGEMIEFRLDDRVMDYVGTTVDRAARLCDAANGAANGFHYPKG